MRNEQILKYRNLFEKAAEFALFLDGIEDSCSRESGAAFLYMQDEDEPESQDNKEDDIARDTALRSKVMEFLVGRILKGDSDSPLHKMLLTHGERPVYVRASHLVRDFWLLKTYHADFNRQNGIEVVDGPAAYALLRTDGSGARVL